MNEAEGQDCQLLNSSDMVFGVELDFKPKPNFQKLSLAGMLARPFKGVLGLELSVLWQVNYSDQAQ